MRHLFEIIFMCIVFAIFTNTMSPLRWFISAMSLFYFVAKCENKTKCSVFSLCIPAIYNEMFETESLIFQYGE